MMSINAENLFVFNDQVGSVEALFGAETDTAAQVKAEYLYSSYGEVMMKSGDLADKNNITYSTRYREGNTGLVGYTYRHHSPRLKKWLSKDPIAEQGGINLYQMVGNNPVGNWDILGFSWKKSKREGGKIEYIGEWPYDNEKTLSNIIRLNAGEYSKWASDEEIDEEECTISVKVPNTILAIWAGDGRWFGRFYTNWNSQIRSLKNNFHVVEIDGNKENPMSTLEDLVKKSELYGIFFWGHGSKNKNGNYLGLTVKGGNLSFAKIRDKLKYKLGFLDLHACGTLAGEDLATPDAIKNLFEGTMYPLPGGWGIEFSSWWLWD